MSTSIRNEVLFSIWRTFKGYEVRKNQPGPVFRDSGISWESTVGTYPWLWLAKMKVRVCRDQERKRIARLNTPEVPIEY